MAVRQRPESLEQMQPEQLCKIKKNHILAQTDHVKILHTPKTNFHTNVEGKKITKEVDPGHQSSDPERTERRRVNDRKSQVLQVQERRTSPFLLIRSWIFRKNEEENCLERFCRG